MSFLDVLRVILTGTVEGVTSWLPVPPDLHRELLNRCFGVFAGLFEADEFRASLAAVIGFAAGLAVFAVYFHKLNPISTYKAADRKKQTWGLWGRIFLIAFPTAVLKILIEILAANGKAPALLYPGGTGWTAPLYGIAAFTLALIGVLLLFAGDKARKNAKKVRLSDITVPMAIGMGIAELFSVLPGASGIAIVLVTALLLGCSRTVALEISFYSAAPYLVLFNFWKLFEKIFIVNRTVSAREIILLLVAAGVTFAAAYFTIRFFAKQIERRSLKFFGWYRILLGAGIIGYFVYTLYLAR